MNKKRKKHSKKRRKTPAPARETRLGKRRNPLDAIVPLSLICLFFVMCYISPGEARNFTMRPDSPQYSMGAYNLLTEGRYVIYINNTSYPPAFSFGYPIFILPFYILFGIEPGNSVLAAQAAGAGLLVLLYFLGKHVHSRAAGVITALLLLFGSLCFRFWSRLPMSDIPHLFLITLMLFLLLKAITQERWKRIILWFSTGAVFGFAVATREVSITYIFFICLAWCLTTGKSLKRFLRDAVPCALGALPWGIALATFNYVQFGSPLRHGYGYWWSNPCDFISRTFNGLEFSLYTSGKTGLLDQLHNVFGLMNPFAENLLFFVATYSIWIFAVIGLVKTRADDKKKPVLRTVLAYLTAGCGVSILLYFCFWRKDDRFFLPVLPVVYLFASVGLLELARSWKKEYGSKVLERALFLVAVACLIFHAFHSNTELPKLPYPSKAFSIMEGYRAANMPDDAVVLCDWDAVVTTFYVVRGTKREIFPFTRELQLPGGMRTNTYVHTVLLPKKPPDDSGYPPKGNRFKKLYDLGAIDIFPKVAVENTEKVIRWLKTGRMVYTDHYTLQRSRIQMSKDKHGRYVFAKLPKDYPIKPEAWRDLKRLSFIPVNQMVLQVKLN